MSERTSTAPIMVVIGQFAEAAPQLVGAIRAHSEDEDAEAVWRAANDTSGQLRFPAGADAVALARASGEANAPCP